MSEDGVARVWAKLDELKEMLTRLLAVQGEREKICARNEACIGNLEDRVKQLEINQAKWSILAATGSALLTALSVKFFVG